MTGEKSHTNEQTWSSVIGNGFRNGTKYLAAALKSPKLFGQGIKALAMSTVALTTVALAAAPVVLLRIPPIIFLGLAISAGIGYVATIPAFKNAAKQWNKFGQISAEIYAKATGTPIKPKRSVEPSVSAPSSSHSTVPGQGVTQDGFNTNSAKPEEQPLQKKKKLLQALKKFRLKV